MYLSIYVIKFKSKKHHLDRYGSTIGGFGSTSKWQVSFCERWYLKKKCSLSQVSSQQSHHDLFFVTHPYQSENSDATIVKNRFDWIHF